MGYISPYTIARIIEEEALRPAEALRQEHEKRQQHEAAQALKECEEILRQKIDSLRTGF